MRKWERHDWTLLKLAVDWEKGNLMVSFISDESKEVFLLAEGLSDLKIPRREEWGRSASVLDAAGPQPLENGNWYFWIEMQSGDKIEIEAKSIVAPSP